MSTFKEGDLVMLTNPKFISSYNVTKGGTYLVLDGTSENTRITVKGDNGKPTYITSINFTKEKQ